MNDHDIRRAIDDAVEKAVAGTVAAVLAEQKRLHNNEADEVTLQTINMILTTFGIEEGDRVEIRKDFQHLRRWRVSYETVERAGWKAFVTVVITGICGLVWLGIQKKLGMGN